MTVKKITKFSDPHIENRFNEEAPPDYSAQLKLTKGVLNRHPVARTGIFLKNIFK